MPKKTPTPTPDVPPLKGGDLHPNDDGSARMQKAPLADVLKQDAVSVGPNSPGDRNTDAVNALSNAPPYLLSRAETMYNAYFHTMVGEVRTPFANIRPMERAAWLASARSTES